VHKPIILALDAHHASRSVTGRAPAGMNERIRGCG
jgi:hypothetical protein